MEKKGYVHVYIGAGKGKTSAAIGLALRAIGHNINVCVIQFMKGGRYTGEFIASERFMKGRLVIRQFGRGCIKEDKQTKISSFDSAQLLEFVTKEEPCGSCRYCFVNDAIQKQFCEDAYAFAKKVLESNDFGVVILDELNYAVSFGLIPIEKAIELIELKPKEVELIITGRDAHEEILKRADLITEMRKIKHYYEDKNIGARRGIEY